MENATPATEMSSLPSLKSEAKYSVLGPRQSKYASWERAKLLIPNGTQTLSKCPERYVEGVYPVIASQAIGSSITDEEGRTYTDFISGLGAICLGYNHHQISSRVREVIEKGINLVSLPTTLEGSLAEILSNNILCARKSKFFKTGSESLSAAVRVARAYTGKDKVAVCGYHGWHDWYTVSTTRSSGIPKDYAKHTVKFNYNDLESLRECFKEPLAAVIMEPVVYDEPKEGFLKEVLKMAHDHDALLIFDEVVTGLRFGLGGAMKLFDVTPDLACFSKALGNGYPIAALVGFEEFMNVWERPDFFVSGTYGGDAIGLTAGIGTMKVLHQHDDALLKRIWNCGTSLRDGFNKTCELLGIEEVSCVGMAPRTMFKFPTMAHKALFWQECVKQGVLFGYANFTTAAHTMSTVDGALSACDIALRVVKDNWDDPKSMLEGNLPQEVFPAR